MCLSVIKCFSNRALYFYKWWQGTNKSERGQKPVPYSDAYTNTSVTEIHTDVSAAISLLMQCGPLPGTFGGGDSDQAPMSFQSTRGSSVPANYSSHLIWEGEGGETDERGRRRKEIKWRREREGEKEKEEWLATRGTCAFLQEQCITCIRHLSCVGPSVALSIADRMTMFVQYQASRVGAGVG